jgi:hypothetical protein
MEDVAMLVFYLPIIIFEAMLEANASLEEGLIVDRSNRGRRSAVGMAMEFTRVISPVADMGNMEREQQRLFVRD